MRNVLGRNVLPIYRIRFKQIVQKINLHQLVHTHITFVIIGPTENRFIHPDCRIILHAIHVKGTHSVNAAQYRTALKLAIVLVTDCKVLPMFRWG